MYVNSVHLTTGSKFTQSIRYFHILRVDPNNPVETFVIAYSRTFRFSTITMMPLFIFLMKNLNYPQNWFLAASPDMSISAWHWTTVTEHTRESFTVITPLDTNCLSKTVSTFFVIKVLIPSCDCRFYLTILNPHRLGFIFPKADFSQIQDVGPLLPFLISNVFSDSNIADIFQYPFVSTLIQHKLMKDECGLSSFQFHYNWVTPRNCCNRDLS